MITLLAAEGDGAGSAHIVLSLHEVDFVLVAAKEGKEGLFEPIWMLPLPVVVYQEGSFQLRAVSDHLDALCLFAAIPLQVPVLRALEEGSHRIFDGTRRVGRTRIDSFLIASAHEDRVDRVDDLLDEGRNRGRLLVFDHAEVALDAAVGLPVCGIGEIGAAIDDFVDGSFCASPKQVPEEGFEIYGIPLHSAHTVHGMVSSSSSRASARDSMSGRLT